MKPRPAGKFHYLLLSQTKDGSGRIVHVPVDLKKLKNLQERPTLLSICAQASLERS